MTPLVGHFGINEMTIYTCSQMTHSTNYDHQKSNLHLKSGLTLLCDITYDITWVNMVNAFRIRTEKKNVLSIYID